MSLNPRAIALQGIGFAALLVAVQGLAPVSDTQQAGGGLGAIGAQPEARPSATPFFTSPDALLPYPKQSNPVAAPQEPQQSEQPVVPAAAATASSADAANLVSDADLKGKAPLPVITADVESISHQLTANQLADAADEKAAMVKATADDEALAMILILMGANA